MTNSRFTNTRVCVNKIDRVHFVVVPRFQFEFDQSAVAAVRDFNCFRN